MYRGCLSRELSGPPQDQRGPSAHRNSKSVGGTLHATSEAIGLVNACPYYHFWG